MAQKYDKNRRATLNEIESQANEIIDNAIVRTLAEYTSDFVGILNICRQFIFGNDKFFKMDTNKILGMRPGEVFNCIHHQDSEYGCGSGVACKYCDAVNTVAGAITSNTPKESEGRIQVGNIENPTTMNVKVKAVPIEWKKQQFIMLFIQDIGEQKLAELIERTFFHDVLNSAQNLYSILKLSTLHSDRLDNSQDLAGLNLNDIIEQVKYFQKIRNAENGDIVDENKEIDVQEELKRIVNSIKSYAIANNIKLHYISSISIKIRTDLVVFRRIIINMLKNAIEAEKCNSIVEIETKRRENRILIRVKNPYVIPNQVQAQIFQRAYSTKGTGRGIGTYGMRLLAESYLSGKVNFKSDVEAGTVFTLELPSY